MYDESAILLGKARTGYLFRLCVASYGAGKFSEAGIIVSNCLYVHTDCCLSGVLLSLVARLVSVDGAKIMRPDRLSVHSICAPNNPVRDTLCMLCNRRKREVCASLTL